MAIHANAIVSLADAKAFLKESGEQNDEALNRIINGFTAALENVAGRPGKVRTVADQRFDGTGTPEAFLPWTPVQTITQIEIRHDLDDSNVKTVTDTTKFFIKDARAGLIRMTEDILQMGTRNCLFGGTVGFNTTDLEYQLFEEAMYICLADYYPRWQRRELSVVSKSYPEGQATFIPAAAVPASARQKLEPIAQAMGIG